jgi:FemAB-related protein (PEP-CTERM system-associated)
MTMATTESSAAPPPTKQDGRGISSLRVLPVDVSTESLWDRYVQDHPNGTFFHQIAWKRVMEKTYGYKPFYSYVEREGCITGIAPALLVSNWVTGRCLMSLPFAVYGGVCASDPESKSALIAHLEKLASDLRVEHLELRNRNGELYPGYHANARYSTFTMPIVPDTEALYQAFPKDIRYMIRKAEKAGLKAHHGFEHLDAFYHLMTVNLRRLGTPAFPRTLYENLIHEYPGQVTLTVVYAGVKPVAGGMSFSFREWMQPYYIGSLDEAKSMAANNFLWWELIKLAAETGHTTFDFGRSKNASGNFDFKKKWNPKIEPLSYQMRLVCRTEMPNFSPTNPKFQIAANLWKKIPLRVTRIMGPRVVRWFP